MLAITTLSFCYAMMYFLISRATYRRIGPLKPSQRQHAAMSLAVLATVWPVWIALGITFSVTRGLTLLSAKIIRWHND
jgi:hypothetical protein